MSVLVLLIFASLAVATTFLVSFIWAVRSGQYEDTCTPSLRLLMEETTPVNAAGAPSNEAAQFSTGLDQAAARGAPNKIEPRPGKACVVEPRTGDLNKPL